MVRGQLFRTTEDPPKHYTWTTQSQPVLKNEHEDLLDALEKAKLVAPTNEGDADKASRHAKITEGTSKTQLNRCRKVINNRGRRQNDDFAVVEPQSAAESVADLFDRIVIGLNNLIGHWPEGGTTSEEEEESEGDDSDSDETQDISTLWGLQQTWTPGDAKTDLERV